jgi:hypothetical protein
MGDLAGASVALDHCLRAEEAAGLDTFLAATHGNYAEVLMGLGDPEGAARHQLAALDLARSMGQATLIAYSHMVAARFALEDGHVADAVRLQSAADSILAREGVSLYAGDEEQRVALLESARRDLGDDAFERARIDGESSHPDELADETETTLRRRAVLPSTTGG